MIARLRGTARGPLADGLVLDVNGVGYLVAATPAVLRRATAGAELDLEPTSTSAKMHSSSTGSRTPTSASSSSTSSPSVRRRPQGRAGRRLGLTRSGAAQGHRARAITPASRRSRGSGKRPPSGSCSSSRRSSAPVDGVGARREWAMPEPPRREGCAVELGYSLLDAERALADVDPELPAEERVRLGSARGSGVSQFLAPALRPEEEEAERSLRPRWLDDSSARRGSRSSSRSRSRPPRRGRGARPRAPRRPARARQDDARADVREEMGVGLRTVAGPALETEDIAAILIALQPRDSSSSTRSTGSTAWRRRSSTRRSRTSASTSSSARAPAARTLTLDLPPFTLVGATTRTGLLTTPLRDRFGMTFRLGYYDPGQLGTIVRRSARILEVEIADDAAEEIAARSRGTPRIANRILRRVRDVAEVRHSGAITTASHGRRSTCSRSTRRGSSASTASCSRRWS